MTLRFPHKKFLPVLDSPPEAVGKKTFLTRRPISVAGKPILAEKHLQIRPSKSILGRKCYSSTLSGLFKYKESDHRYLFKPDFYFADEKLQDFENHTVAAFTIPAFKETRPSVVEPVFAENVPTTHKKFDYQGSCQPANKKFLPATGQSFETAGTFLFSSPAANFRLQIHSEASITALLGDNFKPAPFKTTSRSVFAIFAPRRKRHQANYSDLQPEFLHKYRQANLNFTYSGQLRPFLAANIASTKTQASSYDLSGIFCRSTKQQRFYSSYHAKIAAPGPDKEILSNLVLESKAVLLPICSNEARDVAHYLVNQQISSKKALSSTSTQRPLSTTRETACEPKFSPSANLSWGRPGRLPLNDTAHQIIENESQLPPRSSPCERRSQNRFKLRLKLRRHSFTDHETSPEPKASKFSAAIQAITLKSLLIDYRNLGVTHTWAQNFARSVANSYLPERSEFRQKRHYFLIGSKSHARYTLKSMKNLLTETFSAYSGRKKLAFSGFNYGKRFPALFSRRNYQITASLQIKKFETTLERGLEFFLTGYSANVTRVCEPDTLKRIRLLSGRYYQKLKVEQLPKRNKTLRLLRFKLHTNKDCFCPASLKPERKIFCNRHVFAVFEEPQRPPTTVCHEIPATIAWEKPLSAENKLRLEHFNFSRLESAQTFMDPFPALKILKNDKPEALHQKHFVLPSIGDKVQKTFFCRQQLLPHPFGFPDFSFPPAVFYSLCSRGILSLPLIKALKAVSTGLYTLKKEQAFLPAISMKNPRKLLFNAANPAMAIRETYLPQQQKQCPQIQPATIIKKFRQNWQETYLPPEMKYVSSLQFKHEKRKKPISPAIAFIERSKFHFAEKDVSGLSISIVTSRKLFLRARKFVNKVFHGLPPLHTRPAEQKIQPQPVKIELSGQHFITKKIGFRYFAPGIKRFLHNFSPLYGALPLGETHFQARFRSFRFPWKPESVHTAEPQAYLLPIETLTPGGSMELSDIIDASIFISVSPIVSIPFMQNFAAEVCPSGYESSGTFTAAFISTGSPSHSFYQAPATIALPPPVTILSQLIDHSSFYRCREKTSTKLKKAYRRYLFKYPRHRENLPSVIETLVCPKRWQNTSQLLNMPALQYQYTINLPGISKISGRNFALYTDKNKVIDSLSLFQWSSFPDNEYEFVTATSRSCPGRINTFTYYLADLSVPSEKSENPAVSAPDRFKTVTQRQLRCQPQSLQLHSENPVFKEKPAAVSSFIPCVADFTEIKTESQGRSHKFAELQSSLPIFKKRSRMNEPLRVKLIRTPNYTYKQPFVPEWIDTEIRRPSLKQL